MLVCLVTTWNRKTIGHRDIPLDGFDSVYDTACDWLEVMFPAKVKRSLQCGVVSDHILLLHSIVDACILAM